MDKVFFRCDEEKPGTCHAIQRNEGEIGVLQTFFVFILIFGVWEFVIASQFVQVQQIRINEDRQFLCTVFFGNLLIDIIELIINILPGQIHTWQKPDNILFLIFVQLFQYCNITIQ